MVYFSSRTLITRLCFVLPTHSQSGWAIERTKYMAKMRVVNTRFWIDDYISNLDPTEKLMFLYFLTNPMTDICGVYEIPLKVVAVETGIDINMVHKILLRFERDNKIFYENGWVAIKNFKKHQSLNPKVLTGMEIGLTKAPKSLVDRLYIDYDSLSHPNSNLNPNSNTNKDSLSASSNKKFNPLGAELLKAFEEVDPKCKTYYGNTTQRKACDYLIDQYGLEVVKERIKILPRTNSLPYFPKINSPYDLKEKWVKLEDAVKSKKIELNKAPKIFL